MSTLHAIDVIHSSSKNIHSSMMIRRKVALSIVYRFYGSIQQQSSPRRKNKLSDVLFHHIRFYLSEVFLSPYIYSHFRTKMGAQVSKIEDSIHDTYKKVWPQAW